MPVAEPDAVPDPSAALHERLTMVADAAGIGLWSRELDTGALHWSAANRALYGLADDDPLPSWDEYLERFVHPEDRDRFVGEAARADLESRPQKHQDYRVRTADGRERWIYSWAAREVREGRRFGFGVNVDVTDRHIAEIERRGRERAEQAREVAEQASRAKTEFLSRMSHELRTPLNAILGFAQLLSMGRERLGDDQRGHLRHIEVAGWHLLDLINDVLDLARIEAGAMTTSTEPVELRALVAEVMPLVQALAAERAVVLLPVTGGEGGAWVRADRRRMKQVLVNLLSNATKYNRRGGTVTVSIGSTAAGRLTLAVRDTGRGFRPEELARLYEPFTRFDREGEAIEGTGIGLVITKRLLELMSCHLTVESQAGVGSVFRIDMPASDAPAAPVASASAEASAGVRQAQHRVLAVEDNPSNVALLRQVLALRPGLHLEVASDGEAGLSRALNEPFDLAILDIDLPGMDGVELCRRLRGEQRTRQLPLLALSANAMPSEIRRARAAGFDQYLTKPIDVAGLLVEVDRLLGLPSAAAHR